MEPQQRRPRTRSHVGLPLHSHFFKPTSDPSSTILTAHVCSNSAAACGTSNPNSKYIYNNVAVANYACVDNTIYYLVGAQGSNRDCTDQGGEAASCSSNYLLGPLPGVSTLDGTQWGGVKVENFIAGFVLFFPYHLYCRLSNHYWWVHE